MLEVSLAAEFAHAAHFIVDLAGEVGRLVLADGLKGSFIGATLFAAHKFGERKARKAFLSGDFADDHAAYGDTVYRPSGIMNFKTKQEFYDQHQRTFDNIELENIFPYEHRLAMMKHIMKASKFCTKENPVVFAHLDKVIRDPVMLAKAQNIMAECWVNYFSSRGNNFQRATTPHGERQKPVEIEYVPVLTFEQNAEIKKFRILHIKIQDLIVGRYPEPENVRVMKDGCFAYDPDHHRMRRLDTLKAICRVLDTAQGMWIRNHMTVCEPTGEFQDVSKPRISEALGPVLSPGAMPMPIAA